MKLWTKLITVPTTNATKQIEAVQMWEVRWYSSSGSMIDYPNISPELESFPTRESAEHFRDALIAAFKLVRNTSGNSVRMSEIKLGSNSDRSVA